MSACAWLFVIGSIVFTVLVVVVIERWPHPDYDDDEDGVGVRGY